MEENENLNRVLYKIKEKKARAKAAKYASDQLEKKLPSTYTKDTKFTRSSHKFFDTIKPKLEEVSNKIPFVK